MANPSFQCLIQRKYSQTSQSLHVVNQKPGVVPAKHKRRRRATQDGDPVPAQGREDPQALPHQESPPRHPVASPPAAASDDEEEEDDE